MTNLTATTDATFEADVLNSDRPVLVDFWAEWCGPCRQVSPILEDLSEEHSDKLVFRALDVDTNPQTAARYGITGVPTLAVFSGGEIVHSIVGARPKAALVRDLERFWN